MLVSSSDLSIRSGPEFGPSSARRSEEVGPSNAGRKELGEGRGWWKMFSLYAWQAVASPSSGEQVLPATRVPGRPPFCPAQWASPEPLPQTWDTATVVIPLSVMTRLGREGGLRALPTLLTPAIGAWHTPSPARGGTPHPLGWPSADSNLCFLCTQQPKAGRQGPEACSLA